MTNRQPTPNAFALIYDEEDREIEVSCIVNPGCPATRWQPADPGEVEIIGVTVDGDEVPENLIHIWIKGSEDEIREQAWTQYDEDQDDCGEDYDERW